LILNALDDPIIGSESFPVELAKENQFVYLKLHNTAVIAHSLFLPSIMPIRKARIEIFRKINPDKD